MAMLSSKDISDITSTGRRVGDVEAQIEVLCKGRRYIELEAAATPSNGMIVSLNAREFGELQRLWREKVAVRAVKFVPASGAASRMFDFITAIHRKGTEDIKDVSSADFIKFWNDLPEFAFYAELGRSLKKDGINIEAERKKGRIKSVIKYLLEPCGLNYSNLPKLLLRFHVDNGTPRLALEEHIKEAAWFTDGNIHFTVSEEAKEKAKKAASELMRYYANEGINIEVAFSVQERGTDVVAFVPGKDELHRNSDGSLFFRQGGHGALIGNLNRLHEDYILIQNVDNLPGGGEDILGWKRAFMGYFYKRLEELFVWARKVGEGGDLDGAIQFLKERFFCPLDKRSGKEAVLAALMRPLVVISVVPNMGEPGGGPFMMKGPETGELSLQIVEQAQIDMSDKRQREIFMSSTHFNPVFMILNKRDAFGNEFDLTKFGEKSSGYAFFTEKNDLNGRPFVSFDTGLWNGEMADMLKVFVEMSIETFGPAKTVLDLNPAIRPFRKAPYKEIIDIPPLDIA